MQHYVCEIKEHKKNATFLLAKSWSVYYTAQCQEKMLDSKLKRRVNKKLLFAAYIQFHTYIVKLTFFML
jgi:hypothetical protein